MNDDFLKELKKTARDNDTATFKAYSTGLISLIECKHQCFDNNKMSKKTREITNDKEFAEWLKLEGWISPWE